jgi:hypothetical protein
MSSSPKTVGDQLSPDMRRKIARLHKQMRAAEAAGGVQPPPVLDRRTGEMREFGPRRAFDGAWVLEMLSASGCTKEQVDAAIFVLEPMIEHSVKIDADLVGLLTTFYELPSRGQLRQRQIDFNRSQIHLVE